MLNPKGVRELQKHVGQAWVHHMAELSALPRPVSREDVQRLSRKRGFRLGAVQADEIAGRLNLGGT